MWSCGDTHGRMRRSSTLGRCSPGTASRHRWSYSPQKIGDTTAMIIGDALGAFSTRLRHEVTDETRAFDSQVARLKAFGVVISDQALAWLFMWCRQLPTQV
mmetsp:Transcript_20692/g.58707  ORF Transcript_20692/g.58707 Transcript_20692/m.58707 type:complete len:101 (+) Transcript_20692:438-740(+)